VPSKSNQERLLLVSPELANVLAAIIIRLRQENGGTIPLTRRYDRHERTTGPALPHLFQRRRGSWRWSVLGPNTVREMLNRTLDRADLHDAAGQPLRFTAHDFRRIFATEAVNGGLPVHIVSRLLGHANINTSQAYTAVFETTSFAPTAHSSAAAALNGPPLNTASPPPPNGGNSNNTSTNANSNSASALAPTAPAVNTNTPASDARVFAWTPRRDPVS